MLSNLIISEQKFILVLDNNGEEELASNTLRNLLCERGQMEHIIEMQCADLKNEHISPHCYKQIEGKKYANVILPALSDWLAYQRPAKVIEFINELQRCAAVQRMCLWATSGLILPATARFMIPCLEHMADLVLCLQTREDLSILRRQKSTGNVWRSSYKYKREGKSLQLLDYAEEQANNNAGEGNSDSELSAALMECRITEADDQTSESPALAEVQESNNNADAITTETRVEPTDVPGSKNDSSNVPKEDL